MLYYYIYCEFLLYNLHKYISRYNFFLFMVLLNKFINIKLNTFYSLYIKYCFYYLSMLILYFTIVILSIFMGIRYSYRDIR